MHSQARAFTNKHHTTRLQVERVTTANYLGRRRLTTNYRTGQRLWWREPDWKKAYVVFRCGRRSTALTCCVPVAKQLVVRPQLAGPPARCGTLCPAPPCAGC
jgi:hypothetical protein